MRPAFLLPLLSGLIFAAGGEVPRKAPEFRIQTSPQTFISLSQYAGKTVVLGFILTDCSHCQLTTKVLNEIQKGYVARGVQVVESALEPAAASRITDFKKNFGTVFPVGYNTVDEAAKFMGYPPGVPIQMPVIVFIDRYGTIRAQFDGADKMMQQDQEKIMRLTLDQGLYPAAK